MREFVLIDDIKDEEGFVMWEGGWMECLEEDYPTVGWPEDDDDDY
jgi:hypothetical protein